jgi:DNA-binding ferritin-like protein
MKKKRLTENVGIQVVVDPNLHIAVDNMCSEWGNLPYPQLSVFLVHLKFLYFVHQNHHWTCKGDPFYGDHLLFQRLYEGVQEEIDSVAEKTIGLGTSANVDLVLQTSQLMRLMQGYGMSQTIPQPNELAKRSLAAEMNFLACTSKLVESMKECGLLTRGLDNLVAGIEDKHEGHVYLLKQRCLLNM